jgi:hypothetical protein
LWSATTIVVKDNVATVTLVKIARLLGEETVLESGVNDGDVVVTDGHLQLTNGARVAIREPNANLPAVQQLRNAMNDARAFCFISNHGGMYRLGLGAEGYGILPSPGGWRDTLANGKVRRAVEPPLTPPSAPAVPKIAGAVFDSNRSRIAFRSLAGCVSWRVVRLARFRQNN